MRKCSDVDMRMRNPKYMNDEINNCEFLLTDKLFDNDNPIHIEIGMGKGDFLLNMAINNPNINYIGVEKYSSVASVAIHKIKEYKLSNIKIFIGDILNIPEYVFHKIDIIYLNFSDPWPKKRHAKRRLTHESFLTFYNNLFKNNCHIIMKTDNDDLYEFSKESFINFGYKINKDIKDLHKENIFNIETEYERKFSSLGYTIKYLDVEKGNL